MIICTFYSILTLFFHLKKWIISYHIFFLHETNRRGALRETIEGTEEEEEKGNRRNAGKRLARGKKIS